MHYTIEDQIKYWGSYDETTQTDILESYVNNNDIINLKKLLEKGANPNIPFFCGTLSG